MIYSGLDWSGSPGKERGRTIVFAALHIARDDLPRLDSALGSARSVLRLPEGHAFRHNGASSRARREFFGAIQHLQFSGHIFILDKVHWASQQTGKPTGPKCIRDGIIRLVEGCPDGVVARHVLYVDIDPSQKAELVSLKTDIRNALKLARPRRTGYADVRGCPDTRNLGAMIQVAEMIAGEVMDYQALEGPCLTLIRDRLCSV